MKYALALIVAVLVWWHVLRKLLALGHKLSRAGSAAVRAGAAGHGYQAQPAQAMLPCQLCGLHVPHNEAFYRAGRAYCCAAHARQQGASGLGAQEAAPNAASNKAPTD
ncbi:MAG: PP0621 family protein [Brachymonas sp.]|nr:PP0621 family protein [Brachymonas sp.]